MADILVVDDMRAIVDAISRILSQEGIACDVAYNGTEAIEMMKNCQYKVVITDVLMPGHDGFDVIDATHLCSPEAKIIVMTGGGVRISASETLNAIGQRSDVALKKPVSKDGLLNAVYSLVDKAGLKTI
jgi:two-component system response regulator HydG